MAPSHTLIPFDKTVLTFCDLTQSYSEVGGGVRTYLTEKRKFIQANSQHRHVLIVPGLTDKVTREGRHVTIEIASPQVPGSPNYRLLLRSKAVIRALEKHRPNFIECHDAYNLPWAAIAYRRSNPDTLLVAGYHTDFPTVYVENISRKFFGGRVAGKLKSHAYSYAGKLYKKFDRVFALNAEMAQRLGALGVGYVHTLSLGSDMVRFSPEKRDLSWRSQIKNAPILTYVGRLDKEKQADVVLAAFLQLPDSLGAHLVMVGEGNLKKKMMYEAKGKAVSFTGFIKDRDELAKILASSDIYVSAMAHETFGLSIIEAQASGLPVIGVASGAMEERVPEHLGHLGPVGDHCTMSHNIERLWTSGEAQKKGLAARQYVMERFSWEQTFQTLFETIYSDPPVNYISQTSQLTLN